MPKATLEFDLSDHDEADAHKRAMKALDLCGVLFDLDQEMRSDLKHSTGELTTQHWRDRLREIMCTHHVDLEELYR
jgi:hypothetical protein